MARNIRIGILLLVLVIVAGNAWLVKKRSTDWDLPLEVVIYPVNADDSAATAAYIDNLENDIFQPVAEYLAEEGERYQLGLQQPVIIELAPAIDSRPPEAPFGGSIFEVMWWSLRMRWWAWQANSYDGPVDVMVFVTYYDPEVNKELGHSLGLEKGMLSQVKAFASWRQEAANNVIITHELLHTVGAKDKYDPATEMPNFPEGYAEPDRSPRYPQRKAEIMGGLIPLAENELKMPENLGQTVIGPQTASEIGWTGEGG